METKVGTNSYAPVHKKKTQKFCVTIPIYKETLNIDEEISLKRLHKVLKDKSNVYAFCPIDINLDKYLEIFPELQRMEFEPENFTSIYAYSQLCLKYEFYDAFSMYEYMYIYQLDCYLIEDNLEYWCDQEYDYVGAPILVAHADWRNFRINPDNKVIISPAVGNGGFSLRNIKTFKYLTNPNEELRQKYELTDEKLKEVKYEDVYFCSFLNELYEIEKPDYKIALKFGIDMNPDLAYNYFNFEGFPMCIHAFDKNIPFWIDKIDDFNSEELFNYCVNKNKAFIEEYYFKDERWPKPLTFLHVK